MNTPQSKHSRMKAALALLAGLTLSSIANAGITSNQAKTTKDTLWSNYAETNRTERATELESEVIQIDGHAMRFQYKKYGQRPRDGWSLFISLHGGGGTASSVNDSQWSNQIQLGDAYRPRNAIYVAPRAPTDTWNLWHQAHIDKMIDRLIQNFAITEDIDPNKVYLMGFSAGGDGVFQLAPRLADRFAGTAMMAGHPNDASPLGLRNIAFAIHVGENDGAYDRNAKAVEWNDKLAALQTADPEGYKYQFELHKGKGHWMDLDDKVAVRWLQKSTRNPLPKKVVWQQDDVVHDSFYWLAVPTGSAKKGQHATVTLEGQTVQIQKTENISTLLIRLNDDMLDLDRPVTVIAPDGSELFNAKVSRSEALAKQTLNARGDRMLIFFGEIEIDLK